MKMASCHQSIPTIVTRPYQKQDVFLAGRIQDFSNLFGHRSAGIFHKHTDGYTNLGAALFYPAHLISGYNFHGNLPNKIYTAPSNLECNNIPVCGQGIVLKPKGGESNN
jgi:hypothetical protein